MILSFILQVSILEARARKVFFLLVPQQQEVFFLLVPQQQEVFFLLVPQQQEVFSGWCPNSPIQNVYRSCKIAWLIR